MCYRALLLSIVTFLSFVSCAKQDFHKEIAEGQQLYITSSYTGDSEMIQMKPYMATLSMSNLGENLCELTVTYDFTEIPEIPKRPISLIIEDIPVIDENKAYSLNGEGLKGTWSFGGEYEGVSVTGHIDYSGHSQLEITGKVGLRDFTISIRDTSTEYPGSLVDVLAEIEFLDYSEWAFSNTSESPCTVSMKGIYNKSTTLSIESGESGILGYYSEPSESIAEIEITFSYADGRTASLNGDELRWAKEGVQTGCLKKTGTEKDWYIRSVESVGSFEPVRFTRDLFEILP